MRQIFFTIMILLSAAAIAQSEVHKGEPVNTAPLQSTPAVDHSHDAGTISHATMQQSPSVDHSHDAVKQQPSGTAASQPATQSAKGSPHPYKAPSGAEAAHARPVHTQPRHSGPTPVRTPTGAEAAHAKATPVHAAHTGPTPVRAPAAGEHSAIKTK